VSDYAARELPEPVSHEQIKALAVHIIARRAYSIFDVPSTDWHMVFMPLSLGALKGFTEQQCAELALFAIQGEHKTTGWTVNGYPTFMECKLWRTSDFLKAALAEAMVEAMEAVAEGKQT
jgi:hypothetical protein